MKRMSSTPSEVTATREAEAEVYEFLGIGDEPQLSEGNVLSLQNVILENSCQLPRFGADGNWGAETEAGVRCLVGQRGRGFVVQNWPWVEGEMAFAQAQTREQHQGDPVPWWFSWAAAGVGFISIVTVGSILTRGK